MYLLDTHSFLWAAFDPVKLSKVARSTIENPESELFISVASLWEIAILKSLGRIELAVGISEVARLAESEFAARILPIEALHLDRLLSFPFLHRDPFDRLLIAQALSLGMPMIGKDDRFAAYGVQLVW
jgi:PIN domain nuclease of toxin-antitoxin system